MLDDDRPTYGPHPDAVLAVRRRVERARAVVALELAMQAPLKPRGNRSGNPKPRSRAKAKVCAVCLTVYPQAKGYFHSSWAKRCRSCSAKRDAVLKARKAALASWREECRKRRGDS